MENKRTVAKRLRNVKDRGCSANTIRYSVFDKVFSCTGADCFDCSKTLANKLADAIEAEQAELRERVDELNSTFIDLAAIDLLCEKLDMSPDLRGIAEQIRAATKPMKRPHEVDVDALLRLAEDMEEYFAVPPYKMLLANPSTVSGWEKTIRKAVKGVPSWSDLKGVFADNKPQLPEGIQWPRFEDGELVKFGDRFVGYHAKSDQEHEDTVSSVHFKKSGYKINGTVNRHTYNYGEPVKRPEPEVFDADGVPIKVGDTVYGTGREQHVYEVIRLVANPNGRFNVTCKDMNDQEECLCDSSMLTHRKPDTLEDVVSEMIANWYGPDPIDLPDYFDRLRKLMGGE